MTDTTAPAQQDAAADTLREVLARAEYDLTNLNASADFHQAQYRQALDAAEQQQRKVEQLRGAIATLAFATTNLDDEPEPEGAA